MGSMSSRFSAGALALVVAVLVAAGSTATATAAAPAVSTGPTVRLTAALAPPPAPLTRQRQIELEIYRQINQYRVAHGVPALTLNASIDAVARGWSTNLANTGTFAHNPAYSSQIPPGWTAAAENVAWISWNTDSASVTAAKFVDMWVNSPGHLANLANPGYSTTGVGVGISSTGSVYATQNFAYYPR